MKHSNSIKIGLEMNYKTKHDKIIASVKKELDEIKVIKEEYKENNEILREKILQYDQLIKSHNRSVPRGFFA